MLTRILGSSSWQRPQPTILVDFRPAHVTDLVAASASEDQHPDGLAERPLVFAREPQGAELVIAEDPGSSLFLGRRLDPGDGPQREHVAGEQLVEEFREGGEDPVGAIAATSGGDALDELDNVTPADAADGAAAPGRQDDAIEDTLRGLGGGDAVLAADIGLGEGRRPSPDVDSTPRRSRRHNLTRRH